MDALGGFGCHRLCIGVTRAVGKLTAGHAGAGAAVARAAVIAVAAGAALAVTADTVAMSTPHEIDYTLTFDSATLAAAE